MTTIARNCTAIILALSSNNFSHPTRLHAIAYTLQYSVAWTHLWRHSRNLDIAYCTNGAMSHPDCTYGDDRTMRNKKYPCFIGIAMPITQTAPNFHTDHVIGRNRGFGLQNISPNCYSRFASLWALVCETCIYIESPVYPRQLKWIDECTPSFPVLCNNACVRRAKRCNRAWKRFGWVKPRGNERKIESEAPVSVCRDREVRNVPSDYITLFWLFICVVFMLSVLYLYWHIKLFIPWYIIPMCIPSPTTSLHGPITRYAKIAGCACAGNVRNVFPATAG